MKSERISPFWVNGYQPFSAPVARRMLTTLSDAYVVAIVAIILTWAVTASVSSLKYKEESFAHYSMYRAVKEQYQNLIEKAGIRLTENLE